MICPTLEDLKKIPQNCQAKAMQRHVPRYLKKKKKVSGYIFFTIFRETSEPLSSDPCARLKTQIPMHSIDWGCPEVVQATDPISLLISTFGIYLEPRCKSHGQINHFHSDKKMFKKKKLLLYCIFSRTHITRPGSYFQ